MEGWRNNSIRTIEPNKNAYGARKVKKGEGSRRVRGTMDPELHQASDRQMKIHSIGILILTSICPIGIVSCFVFDYPWIMGFYFPAILISTIWLVGAEMKTRRDIPRRGLAMLMSWGSAVLMLLGGIIYAAVT